MIYLASLLATYLLFGVYVKLIYLTSLLVTNLIFPLYLIIISQVF